MTNREIGKDTRRNSGAKKHHLGMVSKLWRYPVKSMLGEECQYLELDERGVVGDRVFAIRDANGKLGSGKTTLRFRQIDGLLAFHAVYEANVPVITFPDGRRLRGDDSNINAALSDTLRQAVMLARASGVSHLDAGPVHLLTTASLAWLKTALANTRIDERRFRPNLLIATSGETRVEQGWLGQILQVGPKVRLRISDATERCRMVTLAQADLPADPQVLERIALDADLQFGVYAEVLSPGRITCGDDIFALAAPCGRQSSLC